MNTCKFIQCLSDLSVQQLIELLDDELIDEYINNMTSIDDMECDEEFYVVQLSDTVLPCFDLVDFEGVIEPEEMNVLENEWASSKPKTFTYQDIYKLCKQINKLGCQRILDHFDL